jgi:glycine cleavage system H protein
MKELDELDLPEDLRYAEDHEWARAEADHVRIGISDYAQDQLGDMVYVELPKVGDTFAQKEQFGTVESVKAVSELYMPVAGEIISVNKALEESPELLNKDPYGKGWMIELKPGRPSGFETLMTRNAYLEMLRGKK